MSDEKKAPVVGIDLGTTNSLVAFMQGDTPVVIPGEDGSRLVPSVVALDEKDEPVVGNAARKYLIEAPTRSIYSVKRLMGRGIEDVEATVEFQDRVCDRSPVGPVQLHGPEYRRRHAAALVPGGPRVGDRGLGALVKRYGLETFLCCVRILPLIGIYLSYWILSM